MAVIAILILHFAFIAAPGPGIAPQATEIVKSSEAASQAKSVNLQESKRIVSAFRENTKYVQINALQREELIKALKEIKGKDWTSSQERIKDMNSPFARRLFNWLWLARYDGNIHTQQTMAYLDTITDWPHQYAIRKKIEESLNISHDIEPASLEKWFDRHPPLTPTGMAFYLNALKKSGQEGKARETFGAFWEQTALEPREQKYFYQNYQRWFKQEHHLARLETLLLKRQYTNARNLARAMGEPEKKLVEASIALKEDKSGVDWYIRQVPEKYINNASLKYERLKWRRRHNLRNSTLSILKSPVQFHTESLRQKWWHERHIAVRHMIEQKNYNQAYRLVSNHLQISGFSYAQAEWVSGWLALNYLDKPGYALRHFQNLFENVTTPISRARGAFWSGKVQERLSNYTLAVRWYERAAAHGGTFYGQMALSRINKLKEQNRPSLSKAAFGKDMNAEPASFIPDYPMPEISENLQQYFQQAEIVQAFKLLHSAGLIKEAEAFIDALARKAKTPEDYRLIADLTFSYEMLHKSLHLAKQASYRSVILSKYQFPQIKINLKDIQKTDLALIQGIIRQESAFQTDAVSHAGARGLMQLMPATAQALARKYNIRHRTSWLTQDPEHNIRLGSIYLQDLLNRYDGSYVLAIAAYNAGPSRVKEWLATYGNPREDEISWVNWIETIPYYETRNYVQRVLEAMHIYQKLH